MLFIFVFICGYLNGNECEVLNHETCLDNNNCLLLWGRSCVFDDCANLTEDVCGIGCTYDIEKKICTADSCKQFSGNKRLCDELGSGCFYINYSTK
jgi:hypothetical protein